MNEPIIPLDILREYQLVHYQVYHRLVLTCKFFNRNIAEMKKLFVRRKYYSDASYLTLPSGALYNESGLYMRWKKYCAELTQYDAQIDKVLFEHRQDNKFTREIYYMPRGYYWQVSEVLLRKHNIKAGENNQITKFYMLIYKRAAYKHMVRKAKEINAAGETYTWRGAALTKFLDQHWTL